MSELPTCNLCDNYLVNYHTGAFGIKHHCDNKQCTLHSVLFTESQWRSLMGEASPEPESADHIPDAGKMVVSAEPVAWMHPNALENFKSGEFNRALIACEKVDDYTMPLYASQPARGCEPITKYVELTREQAFEHLKTNSFHLERTGLYKLVINPDWKPSPPE